MRLSNANAIMQQLLTYVAPIIVVVIIARSKKKYTLFFTCVLYTEFMNWIVKYFFDYNYIGKVIACVFFEIPA